MTGIVKFFDDKGGFGFIEPLIGRPGETENVWFHVSAICRTEAGYRPAIPSGAEVTFDLCRAEGGRVQAANVRLRTVKSSALVKTHL